MIRHWCEAMGDANAAYTGPDAVAPPTMLQVWTMGGLSGHEGGSDAYDELLGLLDEAGCTSVVATDCEQEYLRPLHPGDEITFDAVIEWISSADAELRTPGACAPNRSSTCAGRREARRRARLRILESAHQVEAAGHAGRQPGQRRVWEGVGRHQLLIQRCGGCGTPCGFPGCRAAARAAPRSGTRSRRAEGDGLLVRRHAPPAVPRLRPSVRRGPDRTGRGCRIVSNVIGVPSDKVRIGMPCGSGSSGTTRSWCCRYSGPVRRGDADMDFTPTEEQAAARALAARIFGDLSTSERLASLDLSASLEQGGLPSGTGSDAETWKALCAAGLVAAVADTGLLGLVLLLEEQGRTTAQVPFAASCVYGLLAVSAHGSPEQQGSSSAGDRGRDGRGVRGGLRAGGCAGGRGGAVERSRPRGAVAARRHPCARRGRPAPVVARADR